MTRLPKWLLPAGFAAGVIAAVALVRKPSIKAGDVVAVKKEVLIPLLAGGQLPPVLSGLPNLTQIQKFAVRVVSDATADASGKIVAGLITGEVQGWIDPGSNLPVGAFAGPPVTLTRSAVTDHYRGGKRIG